MNNIYGDGSLQNTTICFSGAASSKPFQVLGTNRITGFDFLEKTQCVPLHFYNKNGDKQANITAWGLAQFRTRYGDAGISGEDIFHYAYAVLHDPHYRAAYAQNLKQDFPRLPFYPDFAAWAAAGRQLLALHLNYETAAPYPLAAVALAPKGPVKPRLKANPTEGSILLTDAQALTGIPAAAWRYRLGNRSALEWVLDQYKERTPKDPTIRAHFDTYRFADHAEAVADLLARVCTVSVETMQIVDALAAQSPLRPGA
ncbi:type ISP restriction/modification enzyme [Hymenobacter caeli]|uniref:Helicase n=1 Tax=Hymenobacter caeli TaxID=2735894 RepID=A0ABX2FPT6_9BACT|nr:putative helicase [Hymenobacter caeli]